MIDPVDIGSSGAPSATTFGLVPPGAGGIPLKFQLAPYLNMDPSVFKQLQPEYIVPEELNATSRRFTHRLHYVGSAVLGSYTFGSLRGIISELFNTQTRRLMGRAWMTRMVNASVKHGSGYAKVAGSVVFSICAVDILFRQLLHAYTQKRGS